jgi:ribosomal protein S6--L-glutamate ligase
MRYHLKMKLLLLTARPDLGINQRFAKEAAALAIDLATVDTTSVCAALGGGPRLLGPGAPEAMPDAVLARVGNWRPESALAVLEAFVARGVATPNPPDAIRQGRDHWATLRILDGAGFPVPETIAGSDPEGLAAAAIELLGLPVVVKQRRSRMGIGVIRCAARDHLEAVLDSLWRIGDEFVVQRWLAGGESSLRLFVVDGSVVAAMRLSAIAGEWRSNASRGAAAEAHLPSNDEESLAIRSAAALGLRHCGVDLLSGPEGPVVVEVNPTPGFMRLEETTGADVARALLFDTLRLVDETGG